MLPLRLPLLGLTGLAIVACGSSVDLVGPTSSGSGGSPAVTVSSSTTGGSGEGGRDIIEGVCQGTYDASLAFGSEGFDTVKRMVLRPDGRVVLAGRTDGDVVTTSGDLLAMGRGGSDAFLMQLSPDLVPEEVRVFGDLEEQGFTDIALTPDGGMVLVGDTEGTVTFDTHALAATNGSDIFVVKLGANGDTEWSHLFGGAGDDRSPSVAVDVAGRIAIGADVEQSIDVDGTTLTATGDTDVMLVQLDPDGSLRWVRVYGDDGPQTVKDLDVFADGAVVLTGSTNGQIDFGSGPVGQPQVDVKHNAFLAKVDDTGEVEWATSFESPTMVRGRTVVVDSEDNVVTAGQFTGAVAFVGETLTAPLGDDLYMLSLTPDGGLRWIRHWGGDSIQNLRTLSVTANDELLFSFPASGGVDWGCGVLDGEWGSPMGGFLRLTSEGDTRFTHIAGDPASPDMTFHQYGEQALELPDGRMLALGGYSGGVDLGAHKASTVGSLDAFIAIISPD